MPECSDLSWRIAQQRAFKEAIEEADRSEFADRAEVKALFDRYVRRSPTLPG
jgi:hypothetical protein